MLKSKILIHFSMSKQAVHLATVLPLRKFSLPSRSATCKHAGKQEIGILIGIHEAKAKAKAKTLQKASSRLLRTTTPPLKIC